jgi:hypothetical protein
MSEAPVPVGGDTIVTREASSLARASPTSALHRPLQCPSARRRSGFFTTGVFEIVRDNGSMKELRSPEALYALIFAICVLIALFLLTS